MDLALLTLFSLFYVIDDVVSYDISRGCPNNIVYPLPSYDIVDYGTYTWLTDKNQIITNKITHHYKTIRHNGRNVNIIVASCYSYNNKGVQKRKNNPDDIRLGVQLACELQSACDAGHIIPSILGGNESATNFVPQINGFNRGVWAKYELAIRDQAPLNSIVTTHYEYVDSSLLNSILSSVGAVPSFLYRQPHVMRSYVYVDGSIPRILFCGTFINQHNRLPGNYIKLDVPVRDWLTRTKPKGTYGSCGDINVK